jgi:hypothetical protein
MPAPEPPFITKSEAPVPYVDPAKDANIKIIVDALLHPEQHGHAELRGRVTAVHAAAIAANIWGESKAQFNATESHVMDDADNDAIDSWTQSGEHGIGIMQWTHNPGRAGDLVTLARTMGKQWYDQEPQLELMMKEISSTQSWRLSSTAFWSTSDVRVATDLFLRKFEVPADPDSVQGQREFAAERILNAINSGRL